MNVDFLFTSVSGLKTLSALPSKHLPRLSLQLSSDPNTDPQQDADLPPPRDYSNVHCLAHSFPLTLKHLGCS